MEKINCLFPVWGNEHFFKKCHVEKKRDLTRTEKVNIGIDKIREKYVLDEQSLCWIVTRVFR